MNRSQIKAIKAKKYNILEKRRLSITNDNPLDDFKDVNGRFIGKRSRLFHSASVNEEDLPIKKHNRTLGVFDHSDKKYR
jgi:hypothetical protein